jgi:hypothetical protein
MRSQSGNDPIRYDDGLFQIVSYPEDGWAMASSENVEIQQL